MTVGTWLQTTTTNLTEAGVGTARLDALVLLEDCLGKDRSWLLAHPEYELTNRHVEMLASCIDMRIRHVPLAYIRGKTEFYGRDFIVNPHVLEPRPETETLIELLLQIPPSEYAAIVDVGTGSGAIAITAALELDSIQVIAIDIDPACIHVAHENSKKHQIPIKLHHSDLLTEVIVPPKSIVAANLPYVPNGYHINSAAMQEPHIAIFGGEDGLDLYRKLFAQCKQQGNSPKYVLTECLPFQQEILADIAAENGYAQTARDDFIQMFALNT